MGGEGKGLMGGGSDRDEAPEGGRPACTVPVLVWLIVRIECEGAHLPTAEYMEAGYRAFTAHCKGAPVPTALFDLGDDWDDRDDVEVLLFAPIELRGDRHRIDAIRKAVQSFLSRPMCDDRAWLFMFTADFANYERIEVPFDPRSPRYA